MRGDRPHFQRPLHLNIVTGWVQPEIEMFGQPMLGHEDRYACAEEWLAIVKRLWTEDESFDHEGHFFKIKKGYLAPKPIQYPYPAIMNAGASELGRHFAIKNCDLVFTVIRTGGLERMHAARAGLSHARARAYGRDIKVWTLVNIVQGETEKEARDFYNYYVHEQGDWEAARNMVDTISPEINKRNYTPEAEKSWRKSSSGLGRLSAGRHQGAGRRRARDAVEGSASTACCCRFRATKRACGISAT